MNSCKPVLATLVLALAACQTGNPKEKENAGTLGGAATGAAIGAAVGGKNPNDRGRNAIIGAVVGGIAGNRVGAYMDEQAKELNEKMEGSGVEVKKQGDTIKLDMPSDITFATDKSAIESQFQPTLAKVADTLKKYPDTAINVLGFTDSTGTAQHNEVLSEQRAKSVASFLAGQGVDSRRLQTKGFGESQPVATNDTAAGRAKNRRVQLELVPVVKEGTAH